MTKETLARAIQLDKQYKKLAKAAEIIHNRKTDDIFYVHQILPNMEDAEPLKAKIPVTPYIRIKIISEIKNQMDNILEELETL